MEKGKGERMARAAKDDSDGCEQKPKREHGRIACWWQPGAAGGTETRETQGEIGDSGLVARVEKGKGTLCGFVS